MTKAELQERIGGLKLTVQVKANVARACGDAERERILFDIVAALEILENS